MNGMDGTKTINGCRVIHRVQILDHVFIEIDYAVFCCERCGLVVCVDKDASPTAYLEQAAMLWHQLGRHCA